MSERPTPAPRPAARAGAATARTSTTAITTRTGWTISRPASRRAAYAAGISLEGIFITEVDPAPGRVPLAVKDLFDPAGIRTTYGSAIFRDQVPAANAEAVSRL